MYGILCKPPILLKTDFAKMKKAVKILLRTFGILLLLVVIAMIALPILYKDQIIEYVKEDVNRQVDAQVDFSDLSISLFSSFPDFRVTLSDFSIVGNAPFEGFPLCKAKQAYLDLNLMSVIKKEKDIQINMLSLTDPLVKIKVLPDGKANYDIYASEETTAASESSEGGYLANLERYSITNGYFSYDDQKGGSTALATGIDHEGRGQFSSDQFDLVTTTTIAELSVGNQVMNYINQDRLEAAISLGVDLKNGAYTIKQNEIVLNALKLIAEGVIKEKGSGYDMDISLAAPNSEFKEVLSILPGAYSKDFKNVISNGSFRLKGYVRGIYDEPKGLAPSVGFELDIDDGAFGYPGMAEGFKKIFANAKIAGDLDKLDDFTFDIASLKFELQNEPFDAQLFLTKIESNPDFKGKIKGKLDLSMIQKVMPLDGVQTLSGFLDVDFQGAGTYQQIQNNQIDAINFGGKARIDQFVYDAVGLPRFELNSTDVAVSPSSLAMTELSGSYGSSDFQGSLNFDNFLAILSPSKTMTGNIKIATRNFDLNELLNFEEAQVTGVEYQGSGEASFDRFDLDAEITAAALQYDVYPIEQLVYRGNIKPNSLQISQCSGKMGKSDFALSGNIDELFNYLYNDQILTGNLSLTSNVLDLNELMSFGESTAPQAKNISDTEEYQPVQIPDRTKIDIKANVDKVYYTDMELRNAKGLINIDQQAAVLNGVKMDALGGKMIFDGKYDTKEAAKPTFDFDYALQKVSFNDVFKYLNTYKMLAPIGQYIDGKFDSSLKFSGSLDKDLNPVLTELTADGFTQTINAVLKSFPPLEKIGQQLNLDIFNSLPIKNSKNWFEIKDGRVVVKEFKQSTQGVDLLIGGSHGLNQDMDYLIKAKIPRSKFKGGIGNQLDKGLGFLEKQAAKVGVNIDQGDFINVAINLTGSIKAPKVKFKVLGADGSSSIKDVVVNTVKEAVEEKVEVVKTEVKEKVNDEKKILQAKMDKEVDAVMKLAEKQAQAARDAGKKAAAKAKDLGYQQANNLVKEAGNNIFKKKAAELAANKIKKETDKKALQIEAEANKKADQVMAKARGKVDGIKKKYNSY